jgi:hypothetical protein
MRQRLEYIYSRMYLKVKKINVNQKKKQKQDVERTKWAKFTFVGKETRLITKIFKNTNVKITFTTDNKIKNHLATRQKQTKINTKNAASTN